MPPITIKKLHRTKGDSGQRRKRTLLPKYKALMAKQPGSDVLEDLDAVRGDR